MERLHIAWFCGLPRQVQEQAFGGRELGTYHDWSWIVGHLPAPVEVDLHVVCPSRHVREGLHADYRGAHFHVIPVLRGGVYTMYADWIRRYRRFTQRLQPHCVHGWGVESGFGIAAIKSSSHHIVEIQGLLSECLPYLDPGERTIGLRLSLWNERRTLRQAGVVVTEGEYAQQAASAYTAAQTHVIPQPLREEFFIAYPGPRDNRTLLFIGAHVKRKGIFDALHAFAAVRELGWQLVCIGSMSARAQSEVVRLVRDLKLENRVQLLGPRSVAEVINHFQHCPVFLLPSYIDTGPNALKEALAMGVWPVCYDNSGPKEFVTRYQYGSLVRTGDVSALAATLRETLTKQPWTDQARALACATAIRRDLDRDRIWPMLLNLYRRVASGAAPERVST